MRTVLIPLCILALTACEQTQWAQQQWADFTATPEWMLAQPQPFAPNAASAPAHATATAAEAEPAATEPASSETSASAAETPPTAAATPLTTVIEEYIAATGEQCRRYAVHTAPDERGEIRTACRTDTAQQWAELRPLTHDTLSPHLPASPFGTAQAAPVLHVITHPSE